jgi:hypothetical protein
MGCFNEFRNVVKTISLITFIMISTAVFSESFENSLITKELMNFDGDIKILKRLSEQGHAQSQYVLGRMYEEGHPAVSENYKKAIYWYTEAVKQGNAVYMGHLGDAYLSGSKDVDRNLEESIKWHRKAATKLHIRSMFVLAQIYSIQREGIKNNILAYKWSLLANHYFFSNPYYNTFVGTYYEEQKGKIKETMTVMQVAEAESIAEKWKKENSR